MRSLRALDADLEGRLVVRHGHPEDVLPALAQEVSAAEVHVAADFGPYGAARDRRVESTLADVALVRTGSAYAVAPGRVRKGDGTPFKVFTPFSRAWNTHGWREPALSPRSIDWQTGTRSDGLPDEPDLGGVALPPAGERAARAAWQAYRDTHLGDYDDVRDRPDLDRTSQLSVHLKYGEIHPRTLLADLAPLRSTGAATYRTELCWREFYADVLHHHPGSARENLNPQFDRMRWDTGAAADARFDAWVAGRTGFPVVDAGMRQLAAEGWMHNRVRMITASFLVKDLHLDWRRGARHFMAALRDGDLASNSHGWQWVAGSGTDASPFFRVFNPITQGKKFDPSGDYVRRYVPELRDVAGAAVHEPWDLGLQRPTDYPEPVVDHAAARLEALERLAETKQDSR